MSALEVLKASLSMNFEAIHQVPSAEQRRIGVVATVLGSFVAVVGVVIGNVISSYFGASSKLFYLLAGSGGIILGIGAYRVGVSYFPGLAGTGKLASLGRMLYVLVVMTTIGAGVLWAMFAVPA